MLRDWLEDRRAELMKSGVAVPRRVFEDEKPGEDAALATEQRQSLFRQLTTGVPDDAGDPETPERILRTHRFQPRDGELNSLPAAEVNHLAQRVGCGEIDFHDAARFEHDQPRRRLCVDHKIHGASPERIGIQEGKRCLERQDENTFGFFPG